MLRGLMMHPDASSLTFRQMRTIRCHYMPSGNAHRAIEERPTPEGDEQYAE